MRNMLLGFFILSILGVVLFAGQGSGNTLDSSVELNKISALKIATSSTSTVMGVNLGTAPTITSVTLTFRNSIAEDDTVSIVLRNGDGTLLGIGSQVVSPSSNTVLITLSNTVGYIERTTLRTVNILVT